MEETTFPPVLMSLINSINAEGHLQSWQLNTTLETYSLTLEWTKSDFCNINDKSDSRPDHLARKPAQTVALNADYGKDASKEADKREVNVKTKYSDSQRCLQSSNHNKEEDTELKPAYSESETPEALMTENEVEYETQIFTQARRKLCPMNKTQICRGNLNRKTQSNLSPAKDNGYHTANFSDELGDDNRVTHTHSKPFSKQDGDKKKAICSCGEVFTCRNLSLRHLLSNCPVSLCFRIELECNVQRVIDGWHGDEKVIGMAWWQSYKNNGFPDAVVEVKDEKVQQLEALVNQFIERAITQTLTDQNGHLFVLMAGLDGLEA